MHATARLFLHGWAGWAHPALRMALNPLWSAAGPCWRRRCWAWLPPSWLACGTRDVQAATAGIRSTSRWTCYALAAVSAPALPPSRCMPGPWAHCMALSAAACRAAGVCAGGADHIRRQGSSGRLPEGCDSCGLCPVSRSGCAVTAVQLALWADTPTPVEGPFTRRPTAALQWVHPHAPWYSA
jgi:hypothetical protein